MPAATRGAKVADTIGIDIGGTKIAAGRVAGDGQVEERLEVPTPQDGDELARVPTELAKRLLTGTVAAVGVGAAGLVRFPEGELVWGPNVSGRGIPFRSLLEDACGLPVVVDNDANVAVLAEARLGAARTYRHVLMVTLGTGIGGGVVIDGRIYRGWSFAGEIGHTVIDPKGPPCSCGRKGCWEQLASGQALTRMAREAAAADPEGAIAASAGDRPARGEDVTKAAAEGDEQALGLVEELARWLGLGLANLIAVLDPQVIVVGGGLGQVGELILGPVRRATARALYAAPYRAETPILAAALREEAGIIGAALAAQEALHG